MGNPDKDRDAVIWDLKAQFEAREKLQKMPSTKMTKAEAKAVNHAPVRNRPRSQN